MNKIFNIFVSVVGVFTIIIFTILNYQVINKDEQQMTINNMETKKYKDIKESVNNEIEQYVETKKKDNTSVLEIDSVYIPDGFKYKEGTVGSGYVIEDENNNEFVWIPTTLAGKEDTVILNRYDYNGYYNIKKDECYENAEDIYEFIDSVDKYRGFYVSRYQIGIVNEKIVSKPNVTILVDISKDEASNKANKMYSSENFNSSLINAFAYDTMLKWIQKSGNLVYESIEKMDEEKELKCNKLTGESKINNIYDLLQNVGVLTTELLEDTIIARGGADLNGKIEIGRRVNVLDMGLNNIGFRTIIFGK